MKSNFSFLKQADKKANKIIINFLQYAMRLGSFNYHFTYKRNLFQRDDVRRIPHKTQPNSIPKVYTLPLLNI